MSPKGLALIVAGILLSSTVQAADGFPKDLTPSLPKQSPVTEGLADLGNVKLWFWDTGGSGETIVLLHPGSGSSESYPYQQPVFARAGFRVISYSRRGQFKSETGNDLETFIAADDLLNLLNRLNVDKCHLIGNALGGYVALDFALSHPERAQSLVLACSMMGISEPEFTGALQAARPKSFASMSVEERELGPTYRSSCPAGVLEWQRRHEQAGKSAPTRLRNRMNWTTIAGLKMPVLLMTGEDDPYLPPAAIRLAADKFPGCEVSIIPHASHAVQWEQPGTFNRVVIDFIHSKSNN